MSSNNRVKLSTKVIIVIFLLFFLSIRAYHLGHSSLWIDEGYSINAALSILEKGTPELDSGSFYNQGIMYNYLSAFLMQGVGFNPFHPITPRIPALLFGFLSIFAIFILARALYNRNIAVLSSFILGLSTWQIAWSQQARGYTGLQFFIILSLYFYFLFLRQRKPSYFLYFALCFLAAYLNHTIAIIFIPSYLIIFLAWIILEFYEYRQKKKLSFTASVKAFSLLSIKKIFKTRNNKLSISKTTLISLSLLIFFVIIYNSLPKVTAYGFTKEYLFFIKNYLLLFTVIAIIGIVQGLLSKKQFFSSIFLFIALVFPLLIIFEYGPMVHIRYLFPLFFIPVIFFSFATYSTTSYIINKIQKQFNTSFGSRIKLIASLLLTFVLLFPLLTILPQKHYPLFFGSPQPNFKEVYEIIKEEKKDNDIVISPYAHLNKIYLQDPGICLPISLSGRSSQTEALIKRGVDHYTGAPLITSKEHLQEVIDSNTGFIVLDQMAVIRLRNQLQEKTIFHSKIKEVYQSGTGLNAIWLYRF